MGNFTQRNRLLLDQTLGVGRATEKIVYCRPATAKTVVVIKNDNSSRSEHWEDAFEAQGDRVVPITVYMGKSDWFFDMHRVLE